MHLSSGVLTHMEMFAFILYPCSPVTGILHKGDGQNIYLGGQRRLVTTLLGTGEQREVDCGRCEGQANQSPLLAPTCLAAAPDGSLYVGDFNLIRCVKTDGTVTTVAMLK